MWLKRIKLPRLVTMFLNTCDGTICLVNLQGPAVWGVLSPVRWQLRFTSGKQRVIVLHHKGSFALQALIGLVKCPFALDSLVIDLYSKKLCLLSQVCLIGLRKSFWLCVVISQLFINLNWHGLKGLLLAYRGITGCLLN